jgi:hypothetical protein
MYHLPPTWYEQENLGHKVHFEGFPRTLWFMRLLLLKCRSQSHCTSVLQASTPSHQNYKLGAIPVRLATVYADKKECAVAKDCSVVQTSCC